MLIFEPLISWINSDFYFSPSRDDEGCTLEAFSIILFCASKLALSKYLQNLADYRLLIISTQRAKTLLRSLRKVTMRYNDFLYQASALSVAVADCAFALCVTKNNWCKQ